MLGFERVGRLIEKNVIEVAPLAYMRGRTLNNSFIILDESQNTTTAQMKMFLTRIGFGSTAVITGDVTQIDLPKGERSGLVHVSQVLKHVEELVSPSLALKTLSDTDSCSRLLKPMTLSTISRSHPFRIRTAAANMTATIELNDACPGHWTPDFNFCLRVLTTACQAVGLNHDVTVSLHFVDAEESLALNSRWREKNTSTNVLSFRADWPEGLRASLPRSHWEIL